MCAALKLPIDVDRLLSNEDPAYLVWVQVVLDRTVEILNEAHKDT